MHLVPAALAVVLAAPAAMAQPPRPGYVAVLRQVLRHLRLAARLESSGDLVFCT